MTIEHFTVDAKLLRELGERLVGRPHMALAELIKNAYDADARVVELVVERDRIVVTDDGHGMSYADFVSRWMRVGTAQKQRDRFSPELQRALTGSKGVGRLSAQLLASELTIQSVALKDPAKPGHRRRHRAKALDLHQEIEAFVDWEDAIEADKLTDAAAEIVRRKARTRFAGDSACGTRIELRGLRTRWDAPRFRSLARELWSLQPPFDVPKDDEAAFRIEIVSEHSNVVDHFREQMGALLELWEARVLATLRPVRAGDDGLDRLQEASDEKAEDASSPEGELPAERPADANESGGIPRVLEIEVHFRDGSLSRTSFLVDHCLLGSLTYEIRVFESLEGHLPGGIRVGEAREYLREYGGVHIYDGRFRLPYYGDPQNDWLRIESDHARRMSESRLLPRAMQVSRAMLDLPRRHQLFGSVHVSTSRETDTAAERNVPETEALAIQITRDRLAPNAAYHQLQRLVRAGMDLFTNERRRRRVEYAREKLLNLPPPQTTAEHLVSLVREIADDIPDDAARDLRTLTRQVTQQIVQLQEAARSHTALLGALATAGMTSLAYEHELSKQMESLRVQAQELEKLAADAPGPLSERLRSIAESLNDWRTRAQRIRAVFTPLLDEEARTSKGRFRARKLLEDVAGQVEVLARGTVVDASGVPSTLRLPVASYAGWSAVFQNLLINAFNAVLDSEVRRVDVDGGEEPEGVGWIRIQDTGIGIDLAKAPRFFEPFERGAPIAVERAALGLGGSGLGLTIVRMVLDDMQASIRFEPPDDAHSTAVRITWETESA